MKKIIFLILCCLILSESECMAFERFLQGLAESLLKGLPESKERQEETVCEQTNVRRLCKIYYEQGYGWSEGYIMEVSFMTGKGLNEATKSYRFGTYTNYALIWFNEGEVAILEIDEYIYGVGDVFDDKDFKSFFNYRRSIECNQVNSEYPRKWKIEAKDLLGRFIDARCN